jgi:hypothetical protein
MILGIRGEITSNVTGENEESSKYDKDDIVVTNKCV